MSPPDAPPPPAGNRGRDWSAGWLDTPEDTPPPYGPATTLPVEALAAALRPDWPAPFCPAPFCPRCGATNVLSEWVTVEADAIRCARCRRRSSRALLERLVAEDADAADRAAGVPA